MKNINLIVLLLAVLLSSCESCIEPEPGPDPGPVSSDPDLYWIDYQDFYNPCTGQYQYLNISHLFWVNNLNNPNYPPQVLLYYEDQSGIFTDCLGFQWFILPGSFLQSDRLMTNKSGGTTARTPSAQARVTVREGNGQTHDMPGGKVSFNDLLPGQTATLKTSIAIDFNNSQYLTEYTADPDNEIAESNEGNNVASDGFSRSDADGAVSFRISVPDALELAKIKTRYVLYRGGQLEVRN